jgi:hypothetical protein
MLILNCLNLAFRIESAANRTPFFISPNAAGDLPDVLSGRALENEEGIELERVKVGVFADVREEKILSMGLS